MVVAKARSFAWEQERSYAPPAGARRTSRGRKAQRKAASSVARVALAAALALLAAGFLLSFLALKTETVRLGYEAVAARQELNNLQDEHERLSLKLARAKSLDRVERVARTELGFVAPSQVRYVDASLLEPPGPQEVSRPVQASPRRAGRLGATYVAVGLISQFVARWFCSIP